MRTCLDFIGTMYRVHHPSGVQPPALRGRRHRLAPAAVQPHVPEPEDEEDLHDIHGHAPVEPYSPIMDDTAPTPQPFCSPCTPSDIMIPSRASGLSTMYNQSDALSDTVMLNMIGSSGAHEIGESSNAREGSIDEDLRPSPTRGRGHRVQHISRPRRSIRDRRGRGCGTGGHLGHH